MGAWAHPGAAEDGAVPGLLALVGRGRHLREGLQDRMLGHGATGIRLQNYFSKIQLHSRRVRVTAAPSPLCSVPS